MSVTNSSCASHCAHQMGEWSADKVAVVDDDDVLAFDRDAVILEEGENPFGCGGNDGGEVFGCAGLHEKSE